MYGSIWDLYWVLNLCTNFHDLLGYDTCPQWRYGAWHWISLLHMQIFDEFDPVAIASASLAQVHVARTRDGQKLAVKVSLVFHFYIKFHFAHDKCSPSFHANCAQIRSRMFPLRNLLCIFNIFPRYSGSAHSHDRYCGCRSCHCGIDCEYPSLVISVFRL